MIVNFLSQTDIPSGSGGQSYAQEVVANWDLIDWHPLGQELVAPAHFELAREQLLAAVAPQSAAAIEQAFDQLALAIEQLPAIEAVAANELRYLAPEDRAYHFLALLSKAHVPDFTQLNIVCNLVECYAALALLSPSRESLDLSSLKRELCRSWRVFVQKDGEVMYERHPVLSPLFRQLSQMEGSLRQQIALISRQEQYAKALQMPTFDVIHDRYVLPIRSDAYNASLGAIVDRSSAGHTLYVEPFEMRQLANQRLELMARIEETKYRICLEYVPLLTAQGAIIIRLYDQLVMMDARRCRALFCSKHNMVRPHIAKKVRIALEDFFHPLVKNPVLNSIDVDQQQMGVILSGPNTGGKTVALKAICLSLIFIHRGLFVPARAATLYPFHGLFFIGHDQQNLSAGLSSFAAEATNYLHLLKNLRQDNAIFIDEIFNSTSSDEASALAQALFDEIHKRAQAMIFVSTHHQFLKTSMHERKNYLSGHVGIDLETRLPTYKLYWGTPGSSHALTIFKRLAGSMKIGEGIVDEAAKHLQSGHRLYESLLEELGQNKAKLERELATSRSLNYELQNQRKASEGVLKLKRQELLQEFEQKLHSYEERARQLLQEIGRGEVSRASAGKRFVQLRSDMLAQSGLRDEPSEAQGQMPDGKWRPLEMDEIQPGVRAHSLRHSKSVDIIAFNPRKQEVTVRLNNLRLNLPAGDLVVEESQRARAVSTRETVVTLDAPSIEGANVRLDARGMRLEDFQRQVENSIYALAQGHLPYIEIIHGHGDGILKKWLRQELKKMPHVRWRIPEGNDGSTIVETA